MREVVISLKTSSPCEENTNFPTEIIQITAVEVENSKVVDKYTTKIKPVYVDRLSSCCEKKTGLTYEDIEYSPKFDEVLKDFYEFIEGAYLFSTGSFDKNLIVNELNDKAEDYVYAELIKNALASNYYNIVAYYNMTFNRKFKNSEELRQHLNVDCFNCNIKEDFEIFIETQDRINKIIKFFFTNKRLKIIIDAINKIHKEHHKITLYEWSNNIVHESIESDTVDILTPLQFVRKWSDTMIIDNTILDYEYLEPKELDLLQRQIDFQRNLSIYSQ